MLERLIEPILAPFRYIRTMIWGIKQAPQQLKGEVMRARSQADQVRGDVRGVKSDVTGMKGQAQKMQGKGNPFPGQAQQQGAGFGGSAPMPARQKMGLFSKKKKCPACGQKLHSSWEECPFCGWGKGGGAPTAAPPSSGVKQRTMAMDVGAAMAPGPASDQFVGWFIPLEGRQKGELLQIKGRITVGTAQDCGIVVSEPSISGHHAEFVPTPNGFRLNDLGSTNGTYVNDKRVSTHDLVDNDNVKLGQVNFKYKSLV